MTKIKVKNLVTPKEKIQGLIGEKIPQPIFFRTRFGIHTFGVRFPIDVLVLDSSDRIVKMVSNMPPNRIFLWPPIYDRVLELPAGEINRCQIAPGTRLTLIFV